MTGTAGYRFRFLLVVVVPAAVLMALEIVSSRLLAPEFGNSVYVWGSIIGVFLAAMSGGYLLGGRIADRRPELPAVGRLLLLAALLQWATALVGRPLVAAVAAATGGRPAGTLIAAALLFGPATLLLATVSPFAVRLAGRDPSRLGGVAGNLFALSTAGSLAGTLAATFVLIPVLPLDAILALLVSGSALSAAASFGAGRPAILGVLVAGAAWATPSLRPEVSGLVVERVTPYQTLRVVEDGNRRYLSSDGTLHGSLDLETGETTVSYAPAAPLLGLYSPQPERVLLLGVGSGGIGRYVAARFPSIRELVFVDIDPAVVEIAREHFGLEPRSGERIVVQDARRFVATEPGGWDWIYVDTYIGHSVPFHLATHEFFELAKSKLTADGVLAVNIAGSVANPFPRAILRTLMRSFKSVEAFGIPASGNHLLIAHRGERLPISTLSARAAALQPSMKPLVDLPRSLRGRLDLDLDLSAVPVLTDSYAPVDSLLDVTARRAEFATGATAP